MNHTILLVQTGLPPTRSYADFPSVDACMEGVCNMFEEHLRNPDPKTLRIPQVTYDTSQLFKFIDDLGDINVFVLKERDRCYIPYDKEWIKEKIYVLLRKRAEEKGSAESLRTD